MSYKSRNKNSNDGTQDRKLRQLQAKNRQQDSTAQQINTELRAQFEFEVFDQVHIR